MRKKTWSLPFRCTPPHEKTALAAHPARSLRIQVGGTLQSLLLHGSHVPCFNLALSVETGGLLAAKQEACLGHLHQDEPDEFAEVQAADHLLKPTIW